MAAGSHIIRIAFKSGSATIGTLPESVNVYANLMTDKWVDASEILQIRKYSPRTISGTTGTDVLLLITSGTNSYTAGLSSTNASTAINVPSSATGIVFMPTAVTTGQTIQYAWGAGSYATISSGQPLSLAFAGTATDLSLKVTDPAGSATVTYIVTVKPATAISSPTELAGMTLAGNYVLTCRHRSFFLRNLDADRFSQHEFHRNLRRRRTYGQQSFGNHDRIIRRYVRLCWYRSGSFKRTVKEREC